MKVVVYGKDNCPYCVAAKEWLNARCLAFNYVDVLKDLNPGELASLKTQYKMNTVPIVVINDELIGGYSNLQRLEL